jgi:hypothetical protein
MLEHESGGVSSTRSRLLLSAMIRDESIYDQFSDKIEPRHFTNLALSYCYLVLSEEVKAARVSSSEFISVAEYRAIVRSNLETSPTLLDADVKAEVRQFLKAGLASSYCADIFSDKKVLRKLLIKTVREMLQAELKREAIEGLVGSKVSTLAERLLDYTDRAQEIEAKVGSNEKRLTFPEDWDIVPVYVYVSTGITFLDALLDGGMCLREVNCFMAPFGTCKTTTASHLTVNGGWASYSDYLGQLHLPEDQRKKGISILVSYEATKSELQYRMMQCAAKIEFDSMRLMGTTGVQALGGPHDPPKSYETAYFRQEIEDNIFESEQERVAKALPWLNEHTFIIDFSAEGGDGGVDEIVSEIQRELAVRGDNCFVHSVFIDYAGLMAERLMSSGKLPARTEEHKLLTNIVGELKRKISVKMSSTVLLFHQLSGAANKMGGAKIRLADKTNAKGSQSFTEHVANAIVASQLNDDQVGLMANQKFRRSLRKPPVAFRVNGAMSRLEESTGYTVDMAGVLAKKSDLVAAPAHMPGDDFGYDPDGADLQDDSETATVGSYSPVSSMDLPDPPDIGELDDDV